MTKIAANLILSIGTCHAEKVAAQKEWWAALMDTPVQDSSEIILTILHLIIIHICTKEEKCMSLTPLYSATSIILWVTQK